MQFLNPPLLQDEDVKHKDFAQFTKHTTGYGQKILEKYGFKGRLGKNENGRVNPIIPKMRKGKNTAGLNFKGADQKPLNPSQIAEMERKINIEKAHGKSGWKKGTKRKIIQKKIELQNIDPLDIKFDKTELFDFTKNQQGSRIKTSDFTSEEPYKDVLLPELRSALKRTVKETERKIINGELERKKHCHERKELKKRIDRLAQMKKELIEKTLRIEKMIELVKKGREMTQKLNDLKNVIGKNDRKSVLRGMSDVMVVFEELRRSFGAEYERVNLSTVLFNALEKHFNKAFNGWSPLEDFKEELSIFKRLQYLLYDMGDADQKDNYYRRLVQRSFSASMAGFISNCWLPLSQNKSLADFFGAFSVVFPVDFLSRAFTVLVVPKLTKHIISREVAIDTIVELISPWIEIFSSSETDIIFSAVQQRLALSLENWNPPEEEIISALSNLSEIMPEKIMSVIRLLVLPKISIVLQKLDINPIRQNFVIFEFMTKWQNLFPMTETILILEKHFFPRWLNIAHLWVSKTNSKKPSLMRDLRNWYLTWKNAFPRNLFKSNRFSENFNCVLDILHSAYLDRKMPPFEIIFEIHNSALEKLSLSEKHEIPLEKERNPITSRKTEEKTQRKISEKLNLNKRKNIDPRFSFKEVVVAFAEEHNVAFYPSAAGSIGGKTIFAFGKNQIYLSSNCAYVKRGERWAPISLKELL